MIHYNIETIMKEAEKAFNERNKGRSEDTLGKCAYLLGYLKIAYTKVYQDLPENKKQMEYLETKYRNVLDNN